MNRSELHKCTMPMKSGSYPFIYIQEKKQLSKIMVNGTSDRLDFYFFLID